MSVRIALTHRIDLRFDRRVRLSTHWLRLRPAPHATGVEAYSLKLDAEPHFLNWLRDPYENQLARLDLPEPLLRLGFDVEIIATLDGVNPFDFLIEPYAASYPFDYPEQLRKELTPYLRVDRPGPWLVDWMSALERNEGYIVEKIGELARNVSRRMPATDHGEPGWVDVESLLRRGHGSAWEAAWLLTLSLRGLGLAARFTSGYRIWLSDSARTADRVARHAWSEVFIPGGGWIGLDPAGGLFCGKGYIPLASAPDPVRALPVCGYLEACREDRGESLTLRRLVPAPAAWPFDGTAWADIRALGHRLDAELDQQDLRLSIGGAISFVAAGNPGAPEWITDAPGADKRRIGEELLSRLAVRLGAGAVPHLGQGEWWAGEELPRWRLGCFYRADGRPIWNQPNLCGWQRHRGVPIRHDEVRLFAETLARALDIAPDLLMPAFEDGLHQLWTNGWAVDWTPRPDELNDPERRRRLAASLSASHAEPAGYVLPLRRDPVRHRWVGGRWQFRRGALFLIAGRSPLGFRLPIDSLPVGEAAVADQEHERCQTEQREGLPDFCGELSARYSTVTPAPDRPGEADAPAEADRPPRTALAVELREGQLYIFLPPLTHLEYYLDLVGAVQSAARETGIPVLLEGYEPPEDYRLKRLVVEPEPGSLKVSLPDADTWQSRVQLLEAVYQEAQLLGLRAERILGDGRRHAPGGAELVLGGRNPNDSPVWRRPALLRSLILYWQRHPSLSYLFAGRVAGPDGPAPRPDEGRDDALYELAIALDRIPLHESDQPWIPDRLLRHLLADPAGNMQRAEIRMDLLYSPDRPGLRLGKTVLRPFETAPDSRLAALQSLLVMALVLALWRKPRCGRPKAWGTALHDRYMLPHVLWDDLTEVLDDLAGAGLPLQPDWFRPLLDRRFPVLGQTRIGDMLVELRSACEPWPLLAEETTGGGVVRFLDSACERLQVRCTGLTPARHLLCCNGYRVPLQATTTPGEFIAGIRYKVWDPPATLHPTVPAVDALVMDLVDTWTGRIVGGCTYVPPRPHVTAAAGWTAAPAPVTPVWKPAPERHPSVPVPPWSSGGGFENQGSAPPDTPLPAALPPETLRPGHPYLLDLARNIRRR